MAKISDLKFLRSIKTGKGLLKLIKSLRAERRATKVKDVKRSVLSKHQRQLVFDKTNGRCHICGIELQVGNSLPSNVSRPKKGTLRNCAYPMQRTVPEMLQRIRKYSFKRIIVTPKT